MSISATIDGTTYSDVQTISVGGKSVALAQTGLPQASGEFTSVNAVGGYTITHNLNHSGVFFIAQRVNSDGSVVEEDTTRYRAVTVIGWTGQISGANIYNTSQEYQYTSTGNPAKITPGEAVEDSYITLIQYYFNSANGGSALGSSSVMGRSTQGVTDYTLNSVTFKTRYDMEPGRWVWKVYALGD